MRDVSRIVSRDCIHGHRDSRDVSRRVGRHDGADRTHRSLMDDQGLLGCSRVWRVESFSVLPIRKTARDEVLRDKWGVDPFFTVSIAAMDPDNGAVRAMIGGESFDSESQFNLATQGRRQPGSSFKTFVLVTALQRGIQTNDKVNGEGPCEFP